MDAGKPEERGSPRGPRRAHSGAAPLVSVYIVCSIISMSSPDFVRVGLAKVTTFSRPCKRRGRPPAAREPPFPVCGCKGTTKFPHKPNFFATFFKLFSPSLTNRLSHNYFHKQNFSTKICPKTCPRNKSPKIAQNPETIFNTIPTKKQLLLIATHLPHARKHPQIKKYTQNEAYPINQPLVLE